MKKLIPLILMLFSSVNYAESFYEYAVHKGENVSGIPLEEYANIWWQWTYTMPKHLSPVRDRTGENCHQGQNGDVWFLTGGYGSSKISRTCTIPEGKYIFFPVINMVYYPSLGGTPSCESVKKGASLNNDELLNITIQLDLLTAENPSHYRLASPECFDLLGLIPKEFGAPKVYPSASDGYWVMLKPLKKGEHTLKFSAQYDRDEGGFSKMVQDIQYRIIVN